MACPNLSVTKRFHCIYGHIHYTSTSNSAIAHSVSGLELKGDGNSCCGWTPQSAVVGNCWSRWDSGITLLDERILASAMCFALDRCLVYRYWFWKTSSHTVHGHDVALASALRRTTSLYSDYSQMFLFTDKGGWILASYHLKLLTVTFAGVAGSHGYNCSCWHSQSLTLEEGFRARAHVHARKTVWQFTSRDLNLAMSRDIHCIVPRPSSYYIYIRLGGLGTRFAICACAIAIACACMRAAPRRSVICACAIAIACACMRAAPRRSVI